MPTLTESIEAMQAILTKVEDVYNSQAALNQKMAVIQMALEETPDEALEAALLETYSNANKNAELIRTASQDYEMKLNVRKMEK